jgi:hypothetical protein
MMKHWRKKFSPDLCKFAASSCLARLLFLTLLLSCLSTSANAQNNGVDPMKRINPRIGPATEIDDQRAAANGIRKIVGEHLTLYTDERDRPDVDELTAVFDQAVDQWCQQFSIDPQRAHGWRLRGFVIENKQRFLAAGLIPEDLPEFPAGYQRGHDLWLYQQPGNYYTRHLLLHEGTHGFMEWFLDGYGCPWYSEGLAELMGLNQWEPATESSSGKLTLGYRLTDRSEAEYWGRVKIIRHRYAAGTALTLADVLNIPATSFRDVEFYAWAWAGCEFLKNHELSQTAFANFYRLVQQPVVRFDASVRQALEPNWEALQRDWRLFISEMDYGCEVRKCGLIDAEKLGEKNGVSRFAIAADHGWQSTALRVKPGQRLKIASTTRFQIAKSTVPVPCEPNGITLEYYRGQPLGILLAGTITSPAPREGDGHRRRSDEIRGLETPMIIGSQAIIEIVRDGILCLRINESPAKMDDNLGVLEVTVEKLE